MRPTDTFLSQRQCAIAIFTRRIDGTQCANNKCDSFERCAFTFEMRLRTLNCMKRASSFFHNSSFLRYAYDAIFLWSKRHSMKFIPDYFTGNGVESPHFRGHFIHIHESLISLLSLCRANFSFEMLEPIRDERKLDDQVSSIHGSILLGHVRYRMFCRVLFVK